VAAAARTEPILKQINPPKRVIRLIATLLVYISQS
jgi:hypothetical protein